MNTPQKQTPPVSRGCRPSFLQISALITIMLFLAMIAIPYVGAVIQGMSSDPTAGQAFGWIAMPIFIIVAPFFLLSLVITIIAMFVSAVQDTRNRLRRVKENPPEQPASPAHNPLPLHTWTITPLFEAVLSNNVETVRAEIAKAPQKINIIYANTGNTPLHVAALNGYVHIVRLLLEQPGIDTNLANLEEKTALDIAREKGFNEIVKLLEDK